MAMLTIVVSRIVMTAPQTTTAAASSTGRPRSRIPTTVGANGLTKSRGLGGPDLPARDAVEADGQRKQEPERLRRPELRPLVGGQCAVGHVLGGARRVQPVRGVVEERDRAERGPRERERERAHDLRRGAEEGRAESDAGE